MMGERIAQLDSKYGHFIIVALMVVASALLSALIYLVKDVPATSAKTAATMESLIPVVEKLALKVEANAETGTENATEISNIKVDRSGVRREYELVTKHVHERLNNHESRLEKLEAVRIR